jgi:hypothetical protein
MNTGPSSNSVFFHTTTLSDKYLQSIKKYQEKSQKKYQEKYQENNQEKSQEKYHK